VALERRERSWEGNFHLLKEKLKALTERPGVGTKQGTQQGDASKKKGKNLGVGLQQRISRRIKDSGKVISQEESKSGKNLLAPG